MAGVEEIHSSVSEGIGATMLIFAADVTAERAISRTRAAVDGIRSHLPRDIEELEVIGVDVGTVLS